MSKKELLKKINNLYDRCDGLSMKLNSLSSELEKRRKTIEFNTRRTEEIARLLSNKLGYNIATEKYIYSGLGCDEIRERLILVKTKK